MHPEVMYQLAKIKIQDEQAWAARERRIRLAHGEPSPDAIAFERPVVHLSFTSRIREFVGSLTSTGRTPSRAAGL